jgi:hypothetical protein
VSTQLQTKDDFDQLFNSIIEEEEYYDRTGRSEDVDEHAYEHYAGLRAAMLDALGVPRGKDFAAEVDESAVQLVQEKVKRYACDFIKATYLLLGRFKCQGEARDFALMLLAATGGNSKQKIILSDEQLEKLTGHSTRTIQRRRAAFRAWEKRAGWTCIEIHEQRRERNTKHIPPTEYRVLLGDVVSDFIREWRSYYQARRPLQSAGAPEEADAQVPELWEDMRREKERAAFAETTSEKTVDRIVGDLLDRHKAIPVPPRSVYTRPAYEGKQRRPDPVTLAENRMLEDLRFCRDQARRNKRPAYSWWEGFKRQAALVLAEPTPGHPEPEEDDGVR